jgi:hypothetical protein
MQMRDDQGKMRPADALMGLNGAVWMAAEQVYKKSPYFQATQEPFKMNDLLPGKFERVDSGNFPTAWKPYVLNLNVWKDSTGVGGTDNCVAAMQRHEKAQAVLVGT